MHEKDSERLRFERKGETLVATIRVLFFFSVGLVFFVLSLTKVHEAYFYVFWLSLFTALSGAYRLLLRRFYSPVFKYLSFTFDVGVVTALNIVSGDFIDEGAVAIVALLLASSILRASKRFSLFASLVSLFSFVSMAVLGVLHGKADVGIMLICLISLAAFSVLIVHASFFYENNFYFMGLLKEKNKKLADKASRLESVSQELSSSSSEVSSVVSSLRNRNEEFVGNLHAVSSELEGNVSILDRGSDSLNRMQSSLHNHRDRLSKMSNTLSLVVQTSQRTRETMSKAVEVAGVIGEIAETMEILAMNAAIEAARTGEHGKGFAVVAQEMRKLAEKTSHEATLVKDTIGQATVATYKLDDIMKEMESDLGLFLSDLSKFLGTVGEVSAGMSSSLGAVERTLSRLRELMKQMEDFSSSYEETESALESIASVVEELADMIVEFRREAEEAGLKKAGSYTTLLEDRAPSESKALKVPGTFQLDSGGSGGA